jgi:hypothetical protein
VLKRSLLLLTVIPVLAVTATASAQGPTEHPAPGVAPGACTDQLRPVAAFGRHTARRARRTHRLRGTASDRGCGLDRVRVSIARKVGTRCRPLLRTRHLGRATSCRHRHWLPVRGTSRWSFRLPARLPHGAYVFRVRAVDFAGNRQHARVQRLRLR